MKKLILLILLAFIAIAPAHAAPRESTYDRVIRTSTIRCGYTPFATGLYKDPNTGELGGIYKDIVEALGNKLGLKIAWTEEVGWGEQIAGLNTGRYDLVCSPANITGPRSRNADLSDTLYFQPIWIYVRGNDPKFDRITRAQLNDKKYKVATIDGEQAEAAANFYLPNAAHFSAPANSDYSMMLTNVVDGKADFAFSVPMVVNDFLKNNPKANLKHLAGDQPLYYAGDVLQMKRGEPEFKAMINNELRDLFASGIVDLALTNHEPYPHSFVRVVKPYEMAK